MCNSRSSTTTTTIPRQAGYVLLLVVGALVLVASLVLGITAWVRDRTQTELASDHGANRTLQLQAHLAAVTAKLKLDQHWISRIASGQSLPRGYTIWVPQPQPYRWEFQGKTIDISIHPANWYPDINRLDPPAFTRLQIALGVPEPEAQAATLRLIAKKQLLAGNGSIKSPATIASVWNGDPQRWYGWTGDSSPPGLLWNLSYGTDTLDTDPNHTPLAVYSALYNPPAAKLLELQKARGKSPLDRAKEQEIVGDPLPEFRRRNTPPRASANRFRVMINPIASQSQQPHNAMLVGDLSISPTQITLHSQYIFYPR